MRGHALANNGQSWELWREKACVTTGGQRGGLHMSVGHRSWAKSTGVRLEGPQSRPFCRPS